MSKSIRAQWRAGAIVALSVAMLAACGGGGGSSSTPTGNNTPPPVPQPTAPAYTLPDPASAPALKDIYGGSFRVGAAIEPSQLLVASDSNLLAKHMSSLTAENVMKPQALAAADPAQSGYAFGPADELIGFARAHGMAVRGHTLLWHFGAPGWFFAGSQDDPVAYRNLVRQRLEAYITAVVTHFKDDVYAWDVVNEVASDTAGQTYRTDSPWYQAFSVGGADGAEYIEIAFRAARAADPDALLFINDYNTELPHKRENLLRVVDDLISKGVPINGVGHQLHLPLNADPEAVSQALAAVEQRNLINHVTELDISIYLDPPTCPELRTSPPCIADYGENPPQSVLAQQAVLYRKLYTTFKAHDTSVESVSTWGIHDAHTWLTAFQGGRTNSPLLFDHQRQPKAAFWAIVDPAFSINSSP
jgi:endo-1,4-beta-xylanase